MAIFHCSIKIISRSSGRSSVAAAAYRAAEKLHNRREGLTHDFTKKGGVAHSEILLPDHAPREFANRQTLWNAVEESEHNKNAQTAREVEVSLPAELDRAIQLNLVREYVQEQFVSRGMCADFNLHDKRDGNPHAHILLTMRPLERDGTWGAKSRKEYVLDRRGERIVLPSGAFKSRKVPATDWDNKENAERWREQWARAVNRELERRGLELIDHRSHERRGLALEPTEHLGKTVSELERMGVVTQRGERNRDIVRRNSGRVAGYIERQDREKERGREQERTR